MTDPIGDQILDAVVARLHDDPAILEALADRVAERLSQRDTQTASPYVTIVEAANLLRTSRAAVDNLLSAGRLSRHKVGRRTLILHSDVVALIERER